MKIMIVNKSDYSTATKYDADEPNEAAYGGPWGNPSQYSHLACPEELDHEVAIAQDDGNGGIELVADSGKEAAKLAAQWAKLRSDRNGRLLACDHTQLSDAPMDQTTKDAWATHRQALRDLPANTEDPTNPSWPAQP